MFAAILFATAHAAAPDVQATPRGSVRGQLVVPARLEDVRAALADSQGRLAAVDNGAKVTSTPDGPCELEHTFMAHPIKAVTYTVRTCPTEQGFHSVLVDSNDLDRFEAIWEIREAEGGTQISYDLDVKPSFPLPGFVVRASMKSGVVDVMTGIERAFAR